MSPPARVGRRTFLASLGAALVLPHLPDRRVRVEGVTPPGRLVAFFTPNGIKNGGSFASGSGADFALGDLLAPLSPFREQLLVLEGLNMSYGGPGEAHMMGIGAFLTGRALQEGDFASVNGERSAGFASGISVDQHIAASLPQETRFASLALGVQVEGANNRHRLSMLGPGDPLIPLDDPYAVFDLVFREASGGRTRRRPQAVIEHSRAEIARLRERLGSVERERLDAHLAALADVERGLQLGPGGDASCRTPDLDEAQRGHVRDAEAFGWVGDRQMDLLHMALSCDLTRIGSLLWGGATSDHRFHFLDPPIPESHHMLTHDDPEVTQPAVWRITTWYAERLAYFLDKLAATPEGDGSMLDNTLVLWGSDLSDAYTHSRHGMQFVLAGNVGGFFRTGQRLTYSGRHHVDLLLTLCRAFGLQDETFGEADLNQGVLEDIIA